jgi:acyl carrier protein
VTGTPASGTPAADGLRLVIEYLEARRPDLAPADPEMDLIENRVLDSLGFVEFLYLLEEHTGQELTLDTISPEDFRTVSRIKARFFDA